MANSFRRLNYVVAGALTNRHMSRAVADMGFYEFRRQLDYKAASRGGLIVVADRWFASSKICSFCKSKLDNLPLSRDKPVSGFIVLLDENPIGYLQSYKVSDYPWPNQNLPEKIVKTSLGMDLFIGNKD